MSDHFMFFRSFRESGRQLSAEKRLELYEAIFDFGLDDITPDKNSDMVIRAVFEAIKPVLEGSKNISKVRSEAGSRGGVAKAGKSKQKLAKAGKRKQSIANASGEEMERRGEEKDREKDREKDQEREITPYIPLVPTQKVAEIIKFLQSMEFYAFEDQKDLVYASKLAEDFKDIGVISELQKALTWIMDNWETRKIKNYRLFFRNWLEKSAKNKTSGNYPGKKQAQSLAEYMQEMGEDPLNIKKGVENIAG